MSRMLGLNAITFFLLGGFSASKLFLSTGQDNPHKRTKKHTLKTMQETMNLWRGTHRASALQHNLVSEACPPAGCATKQNRDLQVLEAQGTDTYPGQNLKNERYTEEIEKCTQLFLRKSAAR